MSEQPGAPDFPSAEEPTMEDLPAVSAETNVLRERKGEEVEEKKESRREEQPGSPEDHPVRIISINEAGDEFELDEEALEEVMTNAAKINKDKIIILSVVGAFRTGKSFLLDFFLRYLKWCEATGQPVPTEAPSLNSIPEWLSYHGDVLREGNASMDEAEQRVGFLWKGGRDRTTTGLWMYGKPFVFTNAEGEKIPVVLMDTQGIFDMKTTKALSAAIFGLSTLISSYQVYNIRGQIQEDKIQQLHYFTEFSRVALTEFERAQTAAREYAKHQGREFKQEAKSDNPFRPFQTLQFLVRDWQNFEDEDDLELCKQSMPVVLEDALQAQVDDEGTREQLRGSFDHMSCFLLPHPGSSMTSLKWDGRLESIRPHFLALLDVYIRQVFGEALVTKKMYGKTVGPMSLVRYIKAYATVFKEGRMPKALTLVQAISATTNLCAKEDAMNMYRAKMNQATEGSTFLSAEQLEACHTLSAKAALEDFNSTATFGDTKQISMTRKALVDFIQSEFSVYVERNEFKMQNGLEKFVIPVVAAFAAFILDWISDYTCDSWSQTCQAASRLLALFYYVVFLLIGYKMWQIYHAQGGATAWVAGMALLTKAGEVVKTAQDSYFPNARSSRAGPPDISRLASQDGQGEGEQEQVPSSKKLD